MPSLGVGLIGTGYMGKFHALAWNAVAPTFGDVERPRLVHLVEVERATAIRRACGLGFAKASGDWRDLVADPEVDVVSITAPNPFRADMGIGVLRAGKHVGCEKPMGISSEDVARMLEVAAASGRVAALGYNSIQSQAIRQIEALVKGGAISAVNHVHIEMDEDFMADQEAPFV